MMRNTFATLTVGSAVLFGCTAMASAQETSVSADYLGVNLGVANVINGKDSALLGLEYRVAPLLWALYPHAGGFVTHRGAVYGYAGLGLEFRITDSILIRGNTAVGAYGQGDDRHLGHVIEFRSGAGTGLRTAEPGADRPDLPPSFQCRPRQRQRRHGDRDHHLFRAARQPVLGL